MALQYKHVETTGICNAMATVVFHAFSWHQSMLLPSLERSGTRMTMYVQKLTDMRSEIVTNVNYRDTLSSSSS